MWLGSNLNSAILVIVEALEKKETSSSESTWLLEMHVPAAAQWFVHASKVILKDGKDVYKNWFLGSQSNVSQTWKGKEGFSKERWEFWKRRLGKVEGMEVYSEETKEWARKADVAMGKAERAKK